MYKLHYLYQTHPINPECRCCQDQANHYYDCFVKFPIRNLFLVPSLSLMMYFLKYAIKNIKIYLKQSNCINYLEFHQYQTHSK